MCVIRVLVATPLPPPIAVRVDCDTIYQHRCGAAGCVMGVVSTVPHVLALLAHNAVTMAVLVFAGTGGVLLQGSHRGVAAGLWGGVPV